MCRRSDHPRIRGEHPPQLVDQPPRAGSSPHTRGAPRPLAPLLLGSRIIPAYAGSTFPSLASTSARRDHPRIRGEHASLSTGTPPKAGSSPHTRGAQPAMAGPMRAAGIIPAYAGSTSGCRQSGPPRWDHPRIRGEHRQEGRLQGLVWGSSPHTRGAPKRAFKNARIVGIIPAYAGSTQWILAVGGRWWDHPRIRGEHLVTCISDAKRAGSSPHTRGALDRQEPADRGQRIIPAYAGSTPRTCAVRGPSSDHPRIRGEHP